MRRSPPFAWVRNTIWAVKNGPQLYKLVKLQQDKLAALNDRIQFIERRCQDQQASINYLSQWQSRVTDRVNQSAAAQEVRPWRN